MQTREGCVAQTCFRHTAGAHGWQQPDSAATAAEAEATRALVNECTTTIVGEVEKTNIDRTALILVGEVLAARDFRDSALYDSAYQRRFRGRGS